MEYYICAFVTLISAVLGDVFSVRTILNVKEIDREIVLYMFARCITLTFIAVTPILKEDVNLLVIITMGMFIVQVIDGFIGVSIKNRLRTLGPFVMAICHIMCLLIYLK